MQTRYILKREMFLLDSKDPRYTLRVRDLPTNEKPREKLIAHGPSHLSIQELLAIILGTGTKKEEVMSMSTRIIREYGEKSILSQKNVSTLAKHLDIPQGKASQIVACGELGRRFFSNDNLTAPIIRTAKEVYEHTKDMHGLSKEYLRGIYLNSHYKVIHDEVISIGTLDSSIVHPREEFRPAIEYAAAAVILVHNHPSGNIDPSEADVSITEQLIQAGTTLGIDLIDHIVVTKDSYKSIPVNYHL